MNIQDVERTFKGENLDMLVYKAYYRTKMCIYADKCVYGDLCYNAHSKNELRIPLCINYYKKKTCAFPKCDRAHDLKLAELPSNLYANLRSKVGEREEIRAIDRVRESARERERKLEKEVDDLKYFLKKRKREEEDSELSKNMYEREVKELKEQNQNLIRENQIKDALLNTMIIKCRELQNIENQLKQYQQFYQQLLQKQVQQNPIPILQTISENSNVAKGAQEPRLYLKNENKKEYTRYPEINIPMFK